MSRSFSFLSKSQLFFESSFSDTQNDTQRGGREVHTDYCGRYFDCSSNGFCCYCISNTSASKNIQPSGKREKNDGKEDQRRIKQYKVITAAVDLLFVCVCVCVSLIIVVIHG